MSKCLTLFGCALLAVSLAAADQAGDGAATSGEVTMAPPAPAPMVYGGRDGPVLYCQDAMKTQPTGACIPPGAFQSEAQAEWRGANMTGSAGAGCADDFDVPAGQTWEVTDVGFWSYCANTSYAANPFASGTVTIYDGDPSTQPPPPILCGPYTVQSAGFTHPEDIYRTSQGVCALDRPIWNCTVDISPPCVLPGGKTYWVFVQAERVPGAGPTGPWANFVTTTGNPSTVAGHHAWQLWLGLWQQLAGGPLPQDIPFRIIGTGGPKPCPGDFNCDGQVNFDDIDVFVAVLGGAPCPCPDPANCDPNGDGVTNFDDIDPFIALLGQPCP